jgi:hypothetical protein
MRARKTTVGIEVPPAGAVAFPAGGEQLPAWAVDMHL